jgi:hypothetical protein
VLKDPQTDFTFTFIKYGDNKLQEEIHALIEGIWTSERMPEEWCNAMICSICRK